MLTPIQLIVLCAGLLLCLHLSAAGLERLGERDREGVITHHHPPDSEFQHFSKEDILKSLPFQGLKVKRQAQEPQQNGRYVFDDGYRQGRVHYSTANSDVIFVLTYNLNNNGRPTASNLYKSTDYGITFTNIESKMDANNPNPILWPVFFVSPANKSMLVLSSLTTSRIYISYNEGVDWERKDFNPSTISPHTIDFSPTQDNWILGHDSTNDRLYVSTDLGSSWTMVAEYVNTLDYQWGDPNWEVNPSTIYYNQYNPFDRHRGNFTVGLYTQTHPYSISRQQEFDSKLGRHDDFLLLGPYIFAQKTRSNGDIYLLVSYRRKPFVDARIPTPYAHQGYQVSHIQERQALVVVKHEGGFYNLYLSEETGVFYSLSLRDIVVEETVDLEMLEGINGTMIANQYLRDDPSQSNAPIRTIITLDNGGNWELIRPPDRDVDKNPVACEPPTCSLHFHMSSSDYARLGVFSTESAPGIIIAHGTLGGKLAQYPDLYLSRDGGVTWEQVLEGSWGVNVLDHGGVIVAVQDYHRTKSTVLKYSCDEGTSWADFEFSDYNITVYGVLTEPGERSTVVSLYGMETNRWVVVTVDFDSIFSRNCTNEDYFRWMPWDDRSDMDCILGSSVVIERRNIHTCCRNGRDYVRETQYTVCECNEEDYECDYGYARPGDDLSGLCARDPDVTLNDPCSSPNVTTYTASTGYRKISGDVCQGGVESSYAPFKASCCASTAAQCSCSQSNGSGLVELGILFAISVLAALILFICLVVLAIMYKILRNRYLKLLASIEPSVEFTTGGEHSENAVLQPLDSEDDDDAPLIP